MARMIPANGPRGGSDCPRSEAWVYDQLRRGLGPDWIVVHAARWVGRSRPNEPLRDGEADFLVAHAEHGLLVLEVKGGGIRYDPSTDRWTSTDGTGALHPVRDPYRQSEQSMHVLMAKLGESPHATPSRPVHGHGVVFPDIQAPTRGFAPHAPSELTLDLSARDHFPQAVEQLLAAWGRRYPSVGNAPSRWWWRAFEDLFLAPREAKVLLRQRIADEQAQLVALSEHQMEVLDMLGRVRRVAVYGPAGTGKTLLAMHKARQLAAQGMNVLLTCYNKALGHHLRDAMADVPNVKALHFHELCYEIADLRSKGVEKPADREGADHWFNADLAQHLIDAAAERGLQYDAIVVDEAQDFLALWWQALESLCTDPGRSIRYLFFDDAQRLRPDAAPVEGAEHAIELQTNWRNTRHIHDHLLEVQPRLRGVRCISPPGAPVEFVPLRPNLPRSLKRVLDRICHEGGVRPDDVVILVGRSPAKSKVMTLGGQISPFRLTAQDEPGCIRVRGVYSFKGMEAPVVILTELDGYAPDRARQLYYVGASRAIHHLIVLGDAIVTLPEAAPATLPQGETR